MLRVLPIFAFFVFSVVVSHAALTSEVYWDTVLPNTPMPKAIQDLLPPDLEEEKSTQVNSKKVFFFYDHAAYKEDKEKPGPKVFLFYATYKEDLKDDPYVSLFFLEEDLHTGTNMNFHFTKTTSKATFLPRQVEKTIPFSSKKLPEILNLFSVKPQSKEAELMKEAIKVCEEPAKEEEDKYCATSLESMIEFSTSKLGKNVKVMSTELDIKGQKKNKQQYYTIAAGVQKMVGNNSVVCHGMNYAYALFFCHATYNTRAYMVPLVGIDGMTKAKAVAVAVAVCHIDTSTWNPKHMAFQVLKVKPGIGPICHFLPEDHILWAQNK